MMFLNFLVSFYFLSVNKKLSVISWNLVSILICAHLHLYSSNIQQINTWTNIQYYIIYLNMHRKYMKKNQNNQIYILHFKQAWLKYSDDFHCFVFLAIKLLFYLRYLYFCIINRCKIIWLFFSCNFKKTIAILMTKTYLIENNILKKFVKYNN